jgi:hypothetical protein
LEKQKAALSSAAAGQGADGAKSPIVSRRSGRDKKQIQKKSNTGVDYKIITL